MLLKDRWHTSDKVNADMFEYVTRPLEYLIPDGQTIFQVLRTPSSGNFLVVFTYLEYRTFSSVISTICPLHLGNGRS